MSKQLADAAALQKIFPAKIGKYALKFDGSKHHHVNRGYTYQLGTTYGNFIYEFLAAPLGPGYVTAIGPGGDHIILIGFDGDQSNGYTVTGNVWNANTAAATSVSTSVSGDRIPHGKCAHIMFWGEYPRLGLSIDCVPAYFTAWDGVRKVTSGEYEMIWTDGGTDHSNGSFYMWGGRLWDPVLPYTNIHQTAPRPAIEHINLSVLGNGAKAALISDYTNASLSDFGNGLNGSLHHGYMAETLSTGAMSFTNTYDVPASHNRVKANLPQIVVKEFAYNSVNPQKTPIPGASYYDDFSGADIHKGNSTALGGWSTRIGNAAWVGTHYGKRGGLLYCDTTSPGKFVYPSVGTGADATFIWRKPTNWFPLGISAAYQLIYRYTDPNNYNFFYVDENGTGYQFSVVAGVQTNLGGFTFDPLAAGWTEVRVVCAGNSVSTFKNGSLRDGPRTITANQTGRDQGVEFNSPLLKLSEIAKI